MGITEVNISFFNPFKIYFKKNGKKGSITIKIIKCGKTTEKNQMTDYKKYNDYIFYLKTEIIKVYKEDTTLNNYINYNCIKIVKIILVLYSKIILFTISFIFLVNIYNINI